MGQEHPAASLVGLLPGLTGHEGQVGPSDTHSCSCWVNLAVCTQTTPTQAAGEGGSRPECPEAQPGSNWTLNC